MPDSDRSELLQPQEILFMGLGKSAVAWYRIALPAMHIGADWVGVYGKPPGVQVLTGIVRGDTTLPRYDDYKVVIIQQPHGKEWLKQIHSLKDRGIKVLFEVDDYLHGVSKNTSHDFAKFYTKNQLKNLELCMRVSDGLICSTEYIARRYRQFNRNVYVCQNGVDLDRYQLTRPERPTVNIGWAGATGHMAAIVPWVNATLQAMREYDNTCFVTIGQPEVARPVNEILGEGRAIGIPFTQLECYPAAMCMVDIMLAPGGTTTWYRGKSDLRWLEAGALGIPVIADPNVYPEIEHGVTGFHSSSPAETTEILRKLLDDPELRESVGAAAREYVETKRSSEIASGQWFEVCCAVAGQYESMHQLRRST